MKCGHKTAVVGMAGVFPGAGGLERFLDNILHKREAIIKIPEERWISPSVHILSKEHVPDHAVSDKAGLVTDFHFDSDGFLLDKDFLYDLDPVHQLVLHAGREAFDQCFHTEEDKKRTGVILAAISLPTDTASGISWQIFFENAPLSPGDFSRAGVVSSPAAFLSRAMGFEGGCFTLDAACASSLYSIKLACEYLHFKKADIMVAGGVSRPDSLYTQIGFTQLGVLSPSGRCSPFAWNADGLVVGEGTGIVVLKRLEDAVECRDRIYAVIAGGGVSNDIEGDLVSPASEGQLRAMIGAYRQASWSPEDIQYMECHGSGTPVGDRVELSSVKTLLENYNCPDKHISIGSVKSMTGHLLTAAGAAGFIKTVLSMNRGFLPPSLNFSRFSSDSPLNDTNIKVQTDIEEWKPLNTRTSRKAGISAFGFGGINAHVLVEEFIEEKTRHFVGAIGRRDFFKRLPCAIIGMEVITKDCSSLSDFESIVFKKRDSMPEKPGSRWRRRDNGSIRADQSLFIKEVISQPGEFHIMPNQMRDILPQHIIMLKAVKGALEDAGIDLGPARKARVKTGCAIGIEFDYEAADFYLRWKINDSGGRLKDRISPSLTFNRTLGSLGGIVASRIAREFRFGGPCFTLSAGAASGMKAVEAGIHSLSLNETDIFICGSVDLAGDIRQFALNDIAKPYLRDGIFPSEGAGAIVLKRLDAALEDSDRIYGVITGISGSSGGEIPGEKCHDYRLIKDRYRLSLERALKDSGIRFSQISLFELNSAGIGEDEKIETDAIRSFISDDTVSDLPFHTGSASSSIGDSKGASGLFSIIKASLSLYYRLVSSCNDIVFWNRKYPRRACASSITMDGACSHAIIEESGRRYGKKRVPFFSDKDFYLFILRSDSKHGLIQKLHDLKAHKSSDLYRIAEKCFFDNRKKSFFTLSIISDRKDNLKRYCRQGLDCVENDRAISFEGNTGLFYRPHPLGDTGKLAFVYPYSGSRFSGMGKGFASLFPDILEKSRYTGWLDYIFQNPETDVRDMIVSHIFFSIFVTEIAGYFNIRPQAALGYSLGESALLFSLRVFDRPLTMLERIKKSSFFAYDPAGNFSCAPEALNLPDSGPCSWKTAAVGRGSGQVKALLKEYEDLYILIVSSLNETIIGGRKEQLDKFIRESGFPARDLYFPAGFHCELLRPVSGEYYDMHKFRCAGTDDIDFYSTYSGRKYIPGTRESADSILKQALYGFNFPRLINQAWDDGVRIFLETGPGSSCTRLVKDILKEREYDAFSLSSEHEKVSLLKALAMLAGHNIDIDLSPVFNLSPGKKNNNDSEKIIMKTGRWLIPDNILERISDEKAPLLKSSFKDILVQDNNEFFLDPALAGATSSAHRRFLEFSRVNMETLGNQFETMTEILQSPPVQDNESPVREKEPFMDRDRCLEFARGKAGGVLGELFDIVDTFPVRVRLPDEPLMLVDRIMDVQGEILSLKSGRIVTQHDVRENAWYLDGGKAPVSISIEAGQADLFLCSYLGIDHAVKGRRKYRLLDAKVSFYRPLPEPCETIEYHIEIERFLRQGGVYLFFFRYRGYINGRLLISMRDGCAGFFTQEEIDNSGGIILKDNKIEKKERFLSLVPVRKTEFSDDKIEALREGDLEAAFGRDFRNICLGKNLRLPGGRMRLIDRVTDFDPTGGRFGLGSITAEKDIHPDDWFLTCHFIDDMVMPGTLMYECCAHALRIFTQRMGWISIRDDVHYDVFLNIESDLKCRGPVTPETKKARYEIEISKMGYDPEPYVIADAHMFSDDLRIVLYRNIGIKITGLTESQLKYFWRQ